MTKLCVDRPKIVIFSSAYKFLASLSFCSLHFIMEIGHLLVLSNYHVFSSASKYRPPMSADKEAQSLKKLEEASELDEDEANDDVVGQLYMDTKVLQRHRLEWSVAEQLSKFKWLKDVRRF